MIGLVVMFLLWVWASGASDRLRVKHIRAMVEEWWDSDHGEVVRG